MNNLASKQIVKSFALVAESGLGSVVLTGRHLEVVAEIGLFPVSDRLDIRDATFVTITRIVKSAVHARTKVSVTVGTRLSSPRLRLTRPRMAAFPATSVESWHVEVLRDFHFRVKTPIRFGRPGIPNAISYPAGDLDRGDWKQTGYSRRKKGGVFFSAF